MTIIDEKRKTATAARANGVTKAYGEGEARVLALDDVTVGIASGRFTAVMLYLVAAALAGVLAAIGPSRRASNVDVLKAVVTE